MIEKIRSYLKSKNMDQFEVFYNKSNNFDLEVASNKIDQASEGLTEGIFVRVLKDKKLGAASTLNIKNYKKCVDTAIKIAKINEIDKDFKSFPTKEKYSKVRECYKSLIDFDIENARDYLNRMMELTVKNEITVPRAFYTKTIEETRVINSEGVDLERKNVINSADLELLEGKNTISIDDASVFPLEPDYKAKEALDRINSLRNMGKIGTQTLPVILHPDALSRLLEHSFTFSINAENVQKHKSILSGKLNKKIMDKRITIEDAALKEGLINTRRGDDEGTPSKVIKIVEDGILKSFIHSSYTANKEGIKSTGNAFRGIQSIPAISTTNLIFSKGDKDNPIKELKKGIYVREVLGAHTMNAITGDFSVGVLEGHYVENGEIKHALKDTMIAGNLLELLNNVNCIGKKIYNCSNAMYLPEILFNKVKVIGQ